MAMLATAAMKISLGLALYVAIILVARVKPRAAGMMLTFPALNGLALLFGPDPEGSARTMLFMPTLNATICLLYIVIFVPVQRGPGWLALSAFGIWILSAYTLTTIRSLDWLTDRPIEYALILSCVGIAIALFGLLRTQGSNASTAPIIAAGWRQHLWQNRDRIRWFMVCLIILVAGTTLAGSSSRLIGVLGGLPLVPLFGLWGVAGGKGKDAIEIRVAALVAMAANVFLGAAVAIWFVYLCSRLVAHGQLQNTWIGGICLLGSWLLVYLAIRAAELLSAGIAKRRNRDIEEAQ